MSHKSGVAGKDIHLYAGVMAEALQAATHCPTTLRRPSPTSNVPGNCGCFNLCDEGAGIYLMA